MLIRLERVLLVVRDKLEGNVEHSESAKHVVRAAQSHRLLEGSDVRRNTKQEEDDVLNNGYTKNVIRKPKANTGELVPMKTRLNTWNNQAGTFERTICQR